MTRSAINREGAEHYTWGAGNDGWHLVRTSELSVIEERMGPGTAEGRHLHRRARQFFFVLAGVLTLEIAGDELALSPGDGAEIEPGIPHQAFNRGTEGVRFLVTSQPPSHGDREPAGTVPPPQIRALPE